MKTVLRSVFALVLIGPGFLSATARDAHALSHPGVCAGVTCNGNGGVPAFQNSNGSACPGGNCVQNPEIVLIFWNDNNQWTGGGNSPSLGTAIGSALSLVDSPYFAALGQYGTFNGSTGQIARPRLSPMADIYSNLAPGTKDNSSNYTWADIDQIIQSEISAGRVPPPHAPSPAPYGQDDVIYVVWVPSNTGANSSSQYCAATSSGPVLGCNRIGSYNGVRRAGRRVSRDERGHIGLDAYA